MFIKKFTYVIILPFVAHNHGFGAEIVLTSPTSVRSVSSPTVLASPYSVPSASAASPSSASTVPRILEPRAICAPVSERDMQDAVAEEEKSRHERSIVRPISINDTGDVSFYRSIPGKALQLFGLEAAGAQGKRNAEHFDNFEASFFHHIMLAASGDRLLLHGEKYDMSAPYPPSKKRATYTIRGEGGLEIPLTTNASGTSWLWVEKKSGTLYMIHGLQDGAEACVKLPITVYPDSLADAPLGAISDNGKRCAIRYEVEQDKKTRQAAEKAIMIFDTDRQYKSAKSLCKLPDLDASAVRVLGSKKLRDCEHPGALDPVSFSTGGNELLCGTVGRHGWMYIVSLSGGDGRSIPFVDKHEAHCCNAVDYARSGDRLCVVGTGGSGRIYARIFDLTKLADRTHASRRVIVHDPVASIARGLPALKYKPASRNFSRNPLIDPSGSTIAVFLSPDMPSSPVPGSPIRRDDLDDPPVEPSKPSAGSWHLLDIGRPDEEVPARKDEAFARHEEVPGSRPQGCGCSIS